MGRRLVLALLVIVCTLVTQLSLSGGVAWAGDPTVDPGLLAQVKADPTREYAVVVRASDASSPSERRAAKAAMAIQSAGGKLGYVLSIVGGASAKLTGYAIIALGYSSAVSWITPDYSLNAKWDPKTGATQVKSPGVITVGAPSVWSQLGATGKGVGVAVVDSGIAPHPDLAGRIVASVDFTGNDLSTALVAPADPGGHGTHVAGLVAGDGTASGGAYTGVAPGAKLIDVRVIGASGVTTLSTVLRGLQWILANRTTYNIRVANLSLGATAQTPYTRDPLATAVEILTFSGVTVVVSAGNAGPGDTTITTPGSDPFVITVGAIDDNATTTTSDDTLASFSSRGPTPFDGVTKPDLVAPGRKMVSLRSPGSTLDTSYPDRRVAGLDTVNPAYFKLSGTSMSAPVVSGVVALMLERNPGLTPLQVKQRLRTSATALSYGSPSTTGAGMVNALAAVTAADRPLSGNIYRVTDGFALDVKQYLMGQPLVFRDLSFNGGVDSRGVPWTSVTWDSIAWEVLTWQNIAWETFNWGAVTWQEIAWEEIAWETTCLSIGSLSSVSGSGSSWEVLP